MILQKELNNRNYILTREKMGLLEGLEEWKKTLFITTDDNRSNYVVESVKSDVVVKIDTIFLNGIEEIVTKKYILTEDNSLHCKMIVLSPNYENKVRILLAKDLTKEQAEKIEQTQYHLNKNDNDLNNLIKIKVEDYILKNKEVFKGEKGDKGDFWAGGVDFKELQFLRFDSEGNTIVRSVNSRLETGQEFVIKRGLRGYTGGTIDTPQAPTSVPFGTIVEWSGEELPDGWTYCNGGTLKVKNYPFLTGTFRKITEPRPASFTIESTTNTSQPSDTNYHILQFNNFGEKTTIKLEKTGLNIGSYIYITPYYVFGYAGNNRGNSQNGMVTNKYYYVDFEKERYLSYLLMDLKNSQGQYEYGSNGSYWGKQEFLLKFEYFDGTNWQGAFELKSGLDFLVHGTKGLGINHSKAKSNKWRFKVENLKDINSNIVYVGLLSLNFDDEVLQFDDLLQLPTEKDSNNRYKIIYIGQPLDIDGFTMYSYDKKGEITGEIPFSLAVNNELPSYAEGITMAEPQNTKAGYKNVYNNDLDRWELVKTHEDKAGYFYDETGTLKYILAPDVFYKWNKELKTWVLDENLKKIEFEKVAQKYIDICLKLDKAMEMGVILESLEQQKLELKTRLEALR